MSTADLERLNRLSRALLDEATAPRPLEGEDEKRPERTMEHADAVLDALAEVGALEALGLTRNGHAKTNRTMRQEDRR